MNADITDLVHESIGRLTDGARIPPGLAERAARRNHQRRTALRTAAATGVATIAAVATLVAATTTGGVPQRGGVPPAQTTAYVLGHAERAMKAAEGRLIEEIHAVGRHHTWFVLGETVGSVCVEEVFPVKRQLPCPKDLNGGLAPDAIYLSYREQFRETGYSAAGRMLWDAGITAGPATPSGGKTLAGVGVDYLSKTWWSITTPGDDGTFHEEPRTGCSVSQHGIDAPIGSPTGWGAQIRNALRCGSFRVAGRQRIGGLNTIRIVAVARDERPYTLWVSPSTYLPVRADNGWLAGDFQWLTPTTANLAALHVRIPETFRRVRARGLPATAFAHG
jgi:hypothetical protein